MSNKKTKRKGNKYSRFVHPRLKEVLEWSAKGTTERQIAKNLGISYSAYNQYKKDYPKLQEVVDEGRAMVVQEVYGALYRVALGYEDVKTNIESNYIVSKEDGAEVLVSRTVKETISEVKPDVGAGVILLKQYDKKSITGNSFTNKGEMDEVYRDEELEVKKSNTSGTSDEWSF